MKKQIACWLLASLFCSAAARAQEPVLVSAQWVKEHLNDPTLVILQVNFMRYDYDKEHIAGARFLWPDWLAADSPEGSFNAPDQKTGTRVLQRLGVSKNSKVVICHTRNEVSVTARMFLTLEYLGLRGQVYFLNGGLEAWKREGYPVTKEEPRSVKKGNFKAHPGDEIVDKDYVLHALQSPTTAAVVDARMKRFYDGESTGNPRDGHITGAFNIPYTEMVDSMNVFKPVAQLESYFTPVSKDKSKELVTYCFIGQTASVVYLAGRVLGYRMKLYDGSMQEWSRREELPMEKTKS